VLARDWWSTSVEHFIDAPDSWLRWHNEKRIKISPSAGRPTEHRESLGLATEISPRNLPQPHPGK